MNMYFILSIVAWCHIGTNNYALRWIFEGVLLHVSFPSPSVPPWETILKGEEHQRWKQEILPKYLKVGPLWPSQTTQYALQSFCSPNKGGGYRLIVDLRHKYSYCQPQTIKYKTFPTLASWMESDNYMVSQDIRDAYMRLRFWQENVNYGTSEQDTLGRRYAFFQLMQQPVLLHKDVIQLCGLSPRTTNSCTRISIQDCGPQRVLGRQHPHFFCSLFWPTSWSEKRQSASPRL